MDRDNTESNVIIQLRKLSDVCVELTKKYKMSEEDSLKLGLAVAGVTIVIPDEALKIIKVPKEDN